MNKKNYPKLSVRVVADYKITPKGFFQDCFAVCEVSQDGHRDKYEIYAPLTSCAAKGITNHLFNSPRMPRFFANSLGEKRRVCKKIADSLTLIVSRRADAYKARGYPLRFTKY